MIRTLFPRLPLLLGLPFFFHALVDSSQANELIRKSSEALTHYVVQSPQKELSSERLLLVSLEQYLGSGFKNGGESPDLELVSGGKLLILKDHSGLVHKSAQIRIGWQKVPSLFPKSFSRQIVGPFASFESAQRVSRKFEAKGVKAIIAHPSDWEVWIPQGIQIPSGIKARNYDEKKVDDIRPVLKLKSGNHLLSGPVSIKAPDGLKWKGGLYSGQFILKPDAYGTWTLIEQIPLEKYLLGVVPHEIGPSSPSAALAAQAVLARTWAIANANRFEIDGYHLCSDTQCQVYKDPNKADVEVLRAIKKTSGKVLTWEGKPVNAVYHATNGGVMASADEAWAIAPVKYLRSDFDGSKRWKKQFSLPINQKSSLKGLLSKRDGAYGNNHYLFRWTRRISSTQLQDALLALRPSFGMPRAINVLKRGDSGRVLAMEIVGRRGEPPIILQRDEIRRTLRNLPSTLFIVEKLEESLWEFIGGGFGHGAGLSQAGAVDLALRGWSTQKILKHYYPGTTYESLR